MNRGKTSVLIVDNYDSFTYNLIQIFKEYNNCRFDVVKNDKVNIKHADEYDGFLFSPGPGIPSEAPVMSELLEKYRCIKSILGICLGHQAIAETFGMKLIKLDTVRHAMAAMIRITDTSDYIFEGMPTEFKAGLYHSWAVDSGNTIQGPVNDMAVTSVSNDGIIMSIRHMRFDIKGVQFHPESYISDTGRKIIHNWIDHLSSGKK